MSEPQERINVLGVGISVLNLESATEQIHDALEQGRRGYICVQGAHGVIEAQDNPELLNAFNRSFLTTPDGMPTVLLGRHFFGKRQMERVYGPDLMVKVFNCQENRGTRHFLYGGNEGVAELLREKLLERFPNAQIVGTYCPPFRELTAEEESDLAAQMREAKPDITWIGLSTPKQDLFMQGYIDRLPTTLMIGVGAAFDFHAGLKPTAPHWVQSISMEWLYRLITEPKRLWPRYRSVVPRFLYLIARQMSGIDRYQL
ncbi:MAG: WecB/TagA/CpsF family glycosyltransferase [Verrucomicrobiales bacterium]